MNNSDSSPSIDPARLLLTVPEAAYVLGISRSVVDGLIRLGHLPAKRVATRVMLSRASLERFADDPTAVEWRTETPREPAVLTPRQPGQGGHVRKRRGVAQVVTLHDGEHDESRGNQTAQADHARAVQ